MPSQRQSWILGLRYSKHEYLCNVCWNSKIMIVLYIALSFTRISISHTRTTGFAPHAPRICNGLVSDAKALKTISRRPSPVSAWSSHRKWRLLHTWELTRAAKLWLSLGNFQKRLGSRIILIAIPWPRDRDDIQRGWQWRDSFCHLRIDVVRRQIVNWKIYHQHRWTNQTYLVLRPEYVVGASNSKCIWIIPFIFGYDAYREFIICRTACWHKASKESPTNQCLECHWGSLFPSLLVLDSKHLVGEWHPKLLTRNLWEIQYPQQGASGVTLSGLSSFIRAFGAFVHPANWRPFHPWQ